MLNPTRENKIIVGTRKQIVENIQPEKLLIEFFCHMFLLGVETIALRKIMTIYVNMFSIIAQTMFISTGYTPLLQK